MEFKKSKNKPFAKKSFGQNFLADTNCIAKIINALNPQPDEMIIEIGPGRGALTEKILESGAHLTAIELDRDLLPVLQNRFAGIENLTLIEADALKIDYSQFREINSGKKIKLAANLPYYISTAILQHLTEYKDEFDVLVLMLQREVVERMTAEPGNSERGFLTVLLEAYFETEMLFLVPPESFNPAPKVWSAVVRLTPARTNAENQFSKKAFREIISAGFAQKRKTLANNLKNFLGDKKLTDKVLQQSGIEANRRAETLSVVEWQRLASEIETLRLENNN